MPTTIPTRVSLLARLRNAADGPAWAEFVHRYTPFVVGVARGAGLREEQIDEVAQETWQAVFQHFRALEAPFSREKGSFRGWLYGVIRYKVLDSRRRERTRTPTIAGEPPNAAAVAVKCDIDQLIEKEWRQHVLRLARHELARQLSPQTYQALDLYAFQDQPAERVARLLNVPIGAVYVAKSRGLKRLAELVAEIARAEDEP